MPRLNTSTMVPGNVGHFGFSGVRPDKLGASEYTLVTIATDKSGSVTYYAKQLLDCVVAIIDACKKSPRANNLLLRYVTFNHAITEEHGFVPLNQIDTAAYQVPNCNGGTALYDASFSSIGASNEYGKILYSQDYSVNGIVFVVTDGDDNSSSMSESDVAEKLKEGISKEFLESQISILIGVNTNTYGPKLDSFSKNVGFTQYVDAGNVSASSLAKLAAFVSRSISSQSSSLGSGGPSQPLTF